MAILWITGAIELLETNLECISWNNQENSRFGLRFYYQVITTFYHFNSPFSRQNWHDPAWFSNTINLEDFILLFARIFTTQWGCFKSIAFTWITEVHGIEKKINSELIPRNDHLKVAFDYVTNIKSACQLIFNLVLHEFSRSLSSLFLFERVVHMIVYTITFFELSQITTQRGGW